MPAAEAEMSFEYWLCTEAGPTQAELDIEEAHTAAEQAGSACYADPATGYSVFTASFLRDKQVRVPQQECSLGAAPESSTD